jgi:hypothetical protein
MSATSATVPYISLSKAAGPKIPGETNDPLPLSGEAHGCVVSQSPYDGVYLFLLKVSTSCASSGGLKLKMLSAICSLILRFL